MTLKLVLCHSSCTGRAVVRSRIATMAAFTWQRRTLWSERATGSLFIARDTRRPSRWLRIVCRRAFRPPLLHIDVSLGQCTFIYLCLPPHYCDTCDNYFVVVSWDSNWSLNAALVKRSTMMRKQVILTLSLVFCFIALLSVIYLC